MHSLSRTMWSRKDVPLVLDTVKTHALRDQEKMLSWCQTQQNWRTKRAPCCLGCVEETLSESRLPRWTFYKCSPSISQRSILSWITTRNRVDRTKVQRERWTCKRRPYVSSLSRETQKTIPSSCWLYQKFLYSASQTNKLKSLSIQVTTRNDIPLHAHRRGTSLHGLGSEFRKFFCDFFFFLVAICSVYSRWGSTVTDKVCRQIHFTRHFSIALHTSQLCACPSYSSRQTTERVCAAHTHSMFMPPWCVFDNVLPASSFWPSLVSLRCLLLHFHTHFFSNVNSVEEQNHFAQRGALHHGESPSSHTFAANSVRWRIICHYNACSWRELKSWTSSSSN